MRHLLSSGLSLLLLGLAVVTSQDQESHHHDGATITTINSDTQHDAHDELPHHFNPHHHHHPTLFQIATLNSSPQRCIHISSSNGNNSSDTKKANTNANTNANTICRNHPNWHDGTNGCKQYARSTNTAWCKSYGHWNHQSTTLNANQACCVCGGGIQYQPRFTPNTYIALKGFGELDKCKHLKIVGIGGDGGTGEQGGSHDHGDTVYIVQVMKGCGPKFRDFTNRGIVERHQFLQGMKFPVEMDDPGRVERYVRVELRKCRKGVKEQQFEFILQTNGAGDEDGREHHHVGKGNYTAIHAETGLDLATSLGASQSMIDIHPTFEKDLFQGSGEIFFMMSHDQQRQRQHQQQHRQSQYLGSGRFGQTEFSEAEWQYSNENKFSNELPYTMWMFKRVEEQTMAQETIDNAATSTSTTTSINGANMDEHAEWLERMTQNIGIDYLQELAPWHLLDVEREASKGDVKARFRELSRTFHPDKVHFSNKDTFEKIFVLLQNAYEGLKSTDEAQKEKFRSSADTDSQLFAHSKHVIELLPFHWTKIGSEIDNDHDNGDSKVEEEDSDARYVIDTATHLNTTNTSSDDVDTPEKSEQLWVIFLYSARCGMSRAIEGFLDLAARHLERYEDVKVGAYGCGLYEDFSPKHTKGDLLGLQSDPICKQFHRFETPNVHVVVETLSGDAKIVAENANFKYFYSSVPHGNSTEFYPHNIIKFAKTGKRIWKDSHLVKKMKTDDFASEEFRTNVSVVAYIDGTGLGETNQEVQDVITTTLPGLARRFLNASVYFGIAYCGWGDEDNANLHVDCSEMDVAWLPDIKIYGANETRGVSLVRGEFRDRRDVQIALESMGNMLSIMLGVYDNEFQDDFEESDSENDEVDGHDTPPSCDSEFPPFPPFEPELNLDKIDGIEKTVTLGMDDSSNADSDSPKPETETINNSQSRNRKPQLASGPNEDGERRKLAGSNDRLSHFDVRQTRPVGRGSMIGGGGGSSGGGAIAG